MFLQVTNKAAGSDASSTALSYVKNTNFEVQLTKETSDDDVSEVDSFLSGLNGPRDLANLRRSTKGSDDTSYKLTQATSARLQIITTDKAGFERLDVSATKSIKSAGIVVKESLKLSNNTDETMPLTYSNIQPEELSVHLKPNSLECRKTAKSYKMSFSEETASKARFTTESVQSSEEEKPLLSNDFYDLSEMSSEIDDGSSFNENFFRMDRNSDIISVHDSQTSSEQS